MRQYALRLAPATSPRSGDSSPRESRSAPAEYSYPLGHGSRARAWLRSLKRIPETRHGSPGHISGARTEIPPRPPARLRELRWIRTTNYHQKLPGRSVPDLPIPMVGLARAEVPGSRNLSGAQLSLLSSAPLDYAITRRQSPNFRSAPRI
jgi:hypothetical protein